MTKRIDPDILAIKQSQKALMQSTNIQMLLANFQYLKDYFLIHPSKAVLEKFTKGKKFLISGAERE